MWNQITYNHLNLKLILTKAKKYINRNMNDAKDRICQSNGLEFSGPADLPYTLKLAVFEGECEPNIDNFGKGDPLEELLI